MFAFGFIVIAIAVWLGDSAIQNRSPIATLEAILRDPANTRTTLTTTKGTGYTPGAGGSGTKWPTPTPSIPPVTPHGGQPAPEQGSTVALTAVSYAVAQIGKPYLHGAEGPNAFDCSGLCYAAYKAAGMTIPRTTATQIIAGRAVAKKDLQPGDLVFPYPGHVFMYVAGGQCVEAPHTGTTIHMTNIYSFFAARRFA